MRLPPTLALITALLLPPLAYAGQSPAPAARIPKPRLLVLTDIGGDPDDQQSMRRLMLYANQFRIVGLVASASGIPGEVGRDVVRPELIREIVDDYAKVRDTLALHAEGFPPAGDLRAVIKSGSPRRGVEHLGPGRATDGSRHITAAVDAAAADDPVHVSIWGGAHDLAQALHDVREARGAEGVAAFLPRLRVYAIADQDWERGKEGTGQWIRKNFPALRYVESQPPDTPRFMGVLRGMYQNDAVHPGAPKPPVQLVRDHVIPMNQQAWVEANVRQGHGPLGANYPQVVQNPGSRNNTKGVKEGDTPSWFYVLPVGLGDPAHPEWGGWGGRFRHDAGGHFVDAEDDHWSGTADAGTRQKWTVARWREAYQNDFAARMDWCVKSFKEANHPPKAPGGGWSAPVPMKAKSGSTVALSDAGWTDTDGDNLSYRWFHYLEPSGFEAEVPIEGGDKPDATVKAPTVTSPVTLHFVLEVTDDGTPPLTRYRRALVTVEPVEN